MANLYIHYWFNHYLNNGVSYGSSPSASKINPEVELEAAVAKAEKDTLDKAAVQTSQAKAKFLENLLNYFMNPKENKHLAGNYDLSSAQRQEIEQAIIETMEEQIQFAEIDFNKGEVKGISQHGKTSSVQARGLKQSKAGENRAFSVWAFQQRVQRMKEQVEAAVAGGLGKDGAEASARMIKVKKEWEAFKRDVLDAQNIKMVAQDSGSIRTTMESFQREIKEIGGLIYAGNLKSKAQGLFGEYAASAIGTIIENMENENVDKILKDDFKKGFKNTKKMTGDNLIQGQVQVGDFTDLNSFDKYQGDRLPEKMQLTDENSLTYTAAASKSKLDLIIDGIGSLSVKNYNLGANTFAQKAGISLVSGTSLFYMLMTEPMFTAHYLNIVGKTGNSKADSGRDTFHETANRFMRRLLFLKAIAGTSRYDENTGATENVNLFAINDSSTGHWRIYEVQQLLNTVAKDVDKYVTVDGIDNNFSVPNTFVSNSKNNPFVNAQIRVNEMIASLNYKINVHAHLDLFK